ncbi:hypothetical protein NC651_026143 [Populus alba x Populus x berolinensis]|nr:hypothetical protein NC651_026143 [Populus alba x Populus x berolinensis]
MWHNIINKIFYYIGMRGMVTKRDIRHPHHPTHPLSLCACSGRISILSHPKLASTPPTNKKKARGRS